MIDPIFQRAELVLGEEAMKKLSQVRVIVFGVGGVGSWCAEGLVRTGVVHLTIVDSDTVAVSNINRQLMTTTATVGQPKVEALRQRLLDINPNAKIMALEQVFTEDTAETFPLGDYDFIIDAIDSLKDKALLIEKACMTGARLFSSMGAALKLNPTRIQVAEFWKVKGDPLARALRNKFKREGRFPKRKFLCVFSDELLKNKGEQKQGEEALAERRVAGTESRKAQVNGSLVHITAVFGFTLAGLVIQNLAANPIPKV